MQIRIDDSDLKELKKTYKKLSKQSPQDLDNLLKDTTAHIEGDMKQNAPVGQYPKGSGRVGGWLRKNIRKGKDENGYFVSSDAEYSLWVEYGNRWWSGVKFFRPAIENGMKYMESEIKRRFNY